MPSFTLILSCVFMAYVGHSVYTFAKIFRAPECTKEPCFSSFLDESPHLQLALFTSHKANPISSEVHLVESIAEFDYSKEFVKYVAGKLYSIDPSFIHIFIPFQDIPGAHLKPHTTKWVDAFTRDSRRSRWTTPHLGHNEARRAHRCSEDLTD